MNFLIPRRGDKSPSFVGGLGSPPWDGWPPECTANAPQGERVLLEGVLRSLWFEVEVDGQRSRLEVAWRAYPSGVFVARASWPFEGRRGRDWPEARNFEHLDDAWFPGSAPPARTTGTVEPGEPAVQVSPDLTRALPAQSSTAPHALAVLPRPVQAGLRRRVPRPTLWLGDLLEFESAATGGIEQVVHQLCLDDTHAVVLTAERRIHRSAGESSAEGKKRLARSPWRVEQLVYNLGPAARLLPSSSSRLRITAP